MADKDLIQSWDEINDPRVALREIVSHEAFLGYDPYFKHLREALFKMADRCLKGEEQNIQAVLLARAIYDCEPHDSSIYTWEKLQPQYRANRVRRAERLLTRMDEIRKALEDRTPLFPSPPLVSSVSEPGEKTGKTPDARAGGQDPSA